MLGCPWYEYAAHRILLYDQYSKHMICSMHSSSRSCAQQSVQCPWLLALLGGCGVYRLVAVCKGQPVVRGRGKSLQQQQYGARKEQNSAAQQRTGEPLLLSLW